MTSSRRGTDTEGVQISQEHIEVLVVYCDLQRCSAGVHPTFGTLGLELPPEDIFTGSWTLRP